MPVFHSDESLIFQNHSRSIIWEDSTFGELRFLVEMGAKVYTYQRKEGFCKEASS